MMLTERLAVAFVKDNVGSPQVSKPSLHGDCTELICALIAMATVIME